MERETKSFETPIQKHKVTIYSYLTGREFEYCQEPMYEAMAPQAEAIRSGEAPKVSMGALNMKKIVECTARTLEKHLVSIDGSTDDLVNKALDMHSEDYQFISQQIQDLAKKN